MKLLYITNGINGSGGLERVLSLKASYFAEVFSYEVHILVLNNTEQNRFFEFSEKIKFHSIPVTGNPISYLLKYRNGIQNTINHIQPDIILVCDDGLKAFFIPRFLKTNAKIIYERHVSKLIEAREGRNFVKKNLTVAKWMIMEKLAKTFSKFIVLTEGNKKDWTSLKNMEVIPNPLSFYPEKCSTLENNVVICVGKISYQKGQDLLVQAWQKVNEIFPDWQLHLYGKEDLSVLDTNNLSHNIKYYPPTKNIEEKYLASSIYVMSSRFEGFGMVLTEAMSFGVPCVAFDCDYGPSDIIKNEIDGFLVEKENTKQLAEKLLLLINNAELRKQMGQKAKVSVKAYHIQEIAGQWKNLFNSLIS